MRSDSPAARRFAQLVRRPLAAKLKVLKFIAPRDVKAIELIVNDALLYRLTQEDDRLKHAASA